MCIAVLEKCLVPLDKNENAWIAQLVEHSPEEGRVGSANLPPSTNGKNITLLKKISMPCFVYMLRSLKNGKYYVGISEDTNRRLKEHNAGKLNNTSKNRPFHLVFRKEYENYALARKHEAWLKKKSVEYKNKLTKGPHL